MAAAAPLILLTGATGFVGSHVLRELFRCHCRVRAVVRAGSENRLFMRDAAESIIKSPDIWREAAAWWTQACRSVDTVIHVAWHVEPGEYLHSPKNRDYLAGTLRLTEGAIAARVRRFIGVGTCFEYDLSAGRLSISTQLKPSTPYAAAKAEAFRTLSALLPRHGLEFAWCRLFYLYGEGEDRRRLVPYLRARLAAGETAELGSGDQVRDYLEVGEAARRLVEAALGTIQGPVNICSGRPVTVRQVAEQVADEYGRRDLLHFGVRPDNPADPPCVVGVPTVA